MAQRLLHLHVGTQGLLQHLSPSLQLSSHRDWKQHYNCAIIFCNVIVCRSCPTCMFSDVLPSSSSVPLLLLSDARAKVITAITLVIILFSYDSPMSSAHFSTFTRVRRLSFRAVCFFTRTASNLFVESPLVISLCTSCFVKLEHSLESCGVSSIVSFCRSRTSSLSVSFSFWSAWVSSLDGTLRTDDYSPPSCAPSPLFVLTSTRFGCYLPLGRRASPPAASAPQRRLSYRVLTISPFSVSSFLRCRHMPLLEVRTDAAAHTLFKCNQHGDGTNITERTARSKTASVMSAVPVC